MKKNLKSLLTVAAVTAFLFATISCSGRASGSGGVSVGASGGAAVSVR
ncbi:MAG: hypothetical protein MI807_15955 [Verrucomicrobiales bacterium]|nr:hypothetical protein [Verrucomicrobiales bacterium]